MMDHHTKHLAHDIVYKDIQFGEWGFLLLDWVMQSRWHHWLLCV